MKYLGVIEKAQGNYSAYSPDVVGCAAAGKTIEQTRCNMKEALELHLQGMIEDREAIPAAQGELASKTIGLEEDIYFCHIQVDLAPEQVA